MELVVKRLEARPGVLSVTVGTRKEGFVVQSSLGSDSEDAKKLVARFAPVVEASFSAFDGTKEKADVVTVRSEKLEYVMTSPGVEDKNLFLLVVRDPSKAI